jgi:glycosyltransferase involved in cell wall biosynthesis
VNKNSYNCKNILFVIDSFSHGGIQQVYKVLIDEYVKTFDSVILIIIQGSISDLKYTNYPNLIVKKLNAKRFLDLKNILRLRKIIKLSKPEIIITSIFRAQIWTALVKPKYSNLIWMEQNVYKHRGKFQWLLMRLVSTRVKKIIAVCNECKDLTKVKLKRDASVIPNPLTFKLSKPKVASRLDDFVFIGRLVAQKNPELAIQSFAEFLKSYQTESYLHIVGDGVLINSLKSLTETLGIKNFCLFYGWIDNLEVSNLLSKCKTLISTSNFGGMEIVRLEALASGCTVVTTNTGGTHFFTTKIDVGFKVISPDPKTFAKNMYDSLNKKYWTQEMLNQRFLVSKRFNSELIALEIIA